jgi:hypothetical protein
MMFFSVPYPFCRKYFAARFGNESRLIYLHPCTALSRTKKKLFLRTRCESVYVIIVCSGCGQFLLAKRNQKTKRCQYCAARLNLAKVKKVFQARTAQEVSSYIRELKSNRKSRTDL